MSDFLTTTTLVFSAMAAGLVWWVGRRDVARDPRLTKLCLVLLGAFPWFVMWLPKLPLLPAAGIGEHLGVTVRSTTCWWRVLWLSGAAVAGVRLLLDWRQVARWRARARFVARLDGVDILALDGLRGAVATGVLRRAVLVPGDWHHWSVSAQRMVLDHELNHHHRHDLLWRWIAELACAIHWYNPLVMWMARRLVLQCEFACDAAVVDNGVDARAYARLLCDCAAGPAPHGPLLAMSAASGLESRVRRLMRPTTPLCGIILVSLAAACVATAGALALLGPRIPNPMPQMITPPQEVELRWSANPFPAEP